MNREACMHSSPSRTFRSSLPLWTCALRHVPYLFLVPCALSLLFSCAQQGNITGGLKDDKPPVVVSSKPANSSTGFKSDNIEITFNEYFELKDIAKQLVVSPPMSKKPEFLIKGKTLKINFKDTLQTDRTYALNFGQALVDLNEGNPYKNFQFVFSTGKTIDSLETSGQVIQLPDNKPAEDVLVMLYDGKADSLPVKTIPLYISRTNKEGKFTLRNLAGGSFKIFALKDGNSNFKFDLPTEAIAFMDSLITPSVMAAPVADTLATVKDTLNPVKDSLNPLKDLVITAKDTAKSSQQVPDTLPKKPRYIYKPDNIGLQLFIEVRPNQYLSGTDRIRGEHIRLKFNNNVDSLRIEFPDIPRDSAIMALEWQGDRDTLDFWIRNKTMAAMDSIRAILVYPAFDSLERRISKTDTVKLRYRAADKPVKGQKNEFTVASSIDKAKILDYGQSIKFTTSLPYFQIDTGLFRLISGKDSTGRKVPYSLIPDTLNGLIMNGLPISQPHPRIFRLHALFAADTAYRLTLLPGALRGFAGQKNDTLDIRFKMKNKDQYGTIKIDLPDLKGPGIAELLDSRGKVVASRMVTGPGTAVFDLLEPGKYSARLILDANGNGKWDPGRYSRHIQPERVKSYSKELSLKANWEMTEIWKWKDL